MLTNGLWNLSTLSTGLEWLNVVASLILAIRIWRIGLRSVFPVLFVFLVFSSVSLLVMEFVPRNTNLYARMYFVIAPIHWVLNFALVYEMFRRVLEEHQGIATAGRWLVTAGVAIAALVTAVTMIAELSAGQQKYPILFAVSVAERAVSTALALLMLILSAFLSYFPVLLRRNSLLIVTGLTVYFLFKALLMLMLNLLGRETVAVVDIANQFLNLAITAIWLWRLVPAVADQLSGPRTVVPQERAEEMLRRLGHMNETLLRSGGR